jgi:hypothetical protein
MACQNIIKIKIRRKMQQMSLHTGNDVDIVEQKINLFWLNIGVKEEK